MGAIDRGSHLHRECRYSTSREQTSERGDGEYGTVDAEVPNSAAIAGNAGRYMWMDSGATAVSSARTPSQLKGTGAGAVVSVSPVTALM